MSSVSPELQRRLHRGDGALILLLEQEIRDAAGLDHKIGKGEIDERVRLPLRPQRRAPGLHHQAQQVAAHGLDHIGPQGPAAQKGVALRLVFQIVDRLLQPHHVRAVDRVDAQKQRRAVGRRRVPGLLGEEGRLIGLDVRLLKAPLHGVGLAAVDLRRARAVAVRQAVVNLHRLGEPVGGLQHRPGLCVEEIPHRRAAEQKRLLLDKHTRRRAHQALRQTVLLRHRVEVGEKVQRVHQVPLAEKLQGVLRLPEQPADALHLAVEQIEGAAGIERVAQPQQRIGIAPLHILRAFPEHRARKDRVRHAVELFGDEAHQLAGEDRLVVPGAVVAAHRFPRLPVCPEDLCRRAQHLAPERLVRLREAAAQERGQQLVGVIGPPRLPVQDQRRAAHKKYIAQFVETKVRMTPDRRDQIKAHAESKGESVNAFINRAIDETMERDGA